jgi:hypothetical protein
MGLNTDQIVQIAKQVATQVRLKIPRSANRFLDSEDGESDWLKDPSQIEYTDFIQTFVRTGTAGPRQHEIKQETRESAYCFFTRTVSVDASIDDLKDAVSDFLREGRIAGARIDLSYKPGKIAERAYSASFAAALADFLNARGLRDGTNRFQSRSVMMKIKFLNWFANQNVVACDPWITDTGSAGSITSAADVGALRDYLKPLTKDGPEFLAVRATGYLGAVPDGFTEKDAFRLPPA